MMKIALTLMLALKGNMEIYAFLSVKDETR